MSHSKCLWTSQSLKIWQAALDSYDTVIGQQGVKQLFELDRWYRAELPKSIARRRKGHVTLTELVKITKWKMSRGVWRARNLALVRGNAPRLVVSTTRRAMKQVPHPTAPIATLSELAGVGPATASAIVAAAAPDIYPFFDDLVAEQIPGIGKLKFNLSCYARYADSIRKRALELGNDWSPVDVERALWAHSGGKSGE
jgi:hypothetical protein